MVSKQIQENLIKLDEWKLKGDELLNSMLPKSIADQLLEGADPLSLIRVKYFTYCTTITKVMEYLCLMRIIDHCTASDDRFTKL